MIRLKKRDDSKPINCDMELGGDKFEIELLPISEKELRKAFAPFQKKKNIYNPVTKQMEIHNYTDDDDDKYMALADDLLDKIVKNFSGVILEVEGEERVLDGTVREDKILLGSVKVEDDERVEIEDEVTGEKAVIKQKKIRPFRTLIFDKAAELSRVTVETERKN